MSSEVIVTYLNIVLYAVSYQLQRPVEPFLVRSLIHNQSNSSSSDTEEESTANQTYGRLTSFFSLIQTIGSPLVGTLLDRIGPRRTSILVYVASACSYWILANSTTPTWLYCSKIPTLLQHAFLVGQATVASLPESKEEDSSTAIKRRAVALGRMTTAYTIGATIGPALGGYLATTDLYAGARLAVWSSLASVFLSIIYLKDHAKKHQNGDSKEDSSPAASSAQESAGTKHASFLQSVQKTLSFLRHPTIGPLMFIKFLNGVSSSVFSTILPLIMANKLHFSTNHMGYFMSASSMSVAVFAAAGISPAMAYVGNRPDRLAFVGMGCRVLSRVTFGVIVSWVMSTMVSSETGEDENDTTPISTNGLIMVTLASVAMSLSSHMHATSSTTLTTGTVSPEERGAILGLEHGLFSMARIVGPPLGTTLLSRGPASGFVTALGIDGLWRVICVCVLMDFVLMTLLKVWSARQCTEFETTESKTDDDEKLTSRLMENHDHSD